MPSAFCGTGVPSSALRAPSPRGRRRYSPYNNYCSAINNENVPSPSGRGMSGTPDRVRACLRIIRVICILFAAIRDSKTLSELLIFTDFTDCTARLNQRNHYNQVLIPQGDFVSGSDSEFTLTPNSGRPLNPPPKERGTLIPILKSVFSSPLLGGDARRAEGAQLPRPPGARKPRP